jgi:hypothetical protein
VFKYFGWMLFSLTTGDADMRFAGIDGGIINFSRSLPELDIFLTPQLLLLPVLPLGLELPFPFPAS